MLRSIDPAVASFLRASARILTRDQRPWGGRSGAENGRDLQSCCRLKSLNREGSSSSPSSLGRAHPLPDGNRALQGPLGGMSVYPLNSSAEALPPNVMARGDGASGRRLGFKSCVWGPWGAVSGFIGRGTDVFSFSPY